MELRGRWWCLGSLWLAAACSSPRSPQVIHSGPVFVIDAGFLFGAAVASYQVEGGDEAADWHLWEQVPLDGGSCQEILQCAQADQGPAFATHFASDLASAGAIGLNGFRFSLEWERLQPGGPDAGYDPAALSYYHGLLAAAADAGLTPLVTLSQGTLPAWLHGIAPGESGLSADEWIGGWRGFPGEDAGPGTAVVQAFGKFAGDMGAEFGGEVDLWLTLDSPMANALQAYVTAGFPPGGEARLSDLQAAVTNLAYANAAAYDALHASDTATAPGGTLPALVGSANVFRLYGAAAGVDPDAGAEAASLLGYLGDFLLPEAFINGNLDTHFDGSFSHPGDPAGEGQALTGLVGRTDFIGVNYHGPVGAIPAPIADSQVQATSDGGPPLTLAGVLGSASFDGGGSLTAAPVSEAIDPAGLHDVLVAVHAQYPLLPIYVTELSLNENTQPDVQRPAFLVGAVQAVQQAMAEGVPVTGVFYRSLVDGFEWQDGFTPRTGLWRVDFSDPNRGRTETQGAQALGQMARAGGVTPAIAADWQ